MEVGTLLSWQDGFDALVGRAREAEELGFGFLGVGDSINRDPYPVLGVLARETKAAMLGTTVTNTITRHPRVTASAIATVDEIAGGRAVLGIGRGFSSVLDIGATPATNLEVAEYIHTLRALLAGRTALWKGKSTKLRWVKRPVPVLLSAYGPRTRRLAGECADGVILTSARIDLLVQGIDEVRSAASASGRDPDGICIWLMVRGSVSDDRNEAIGHHKATLAAAALNLPADDSDLTPTLRKGIAELRSRYRIDEHAVGHGGNAQLLDELGLTEYLAGRFCVAGTPAECRKKVLDIATTGVDLLYFVVDHGGIVDPASMTRRLATQGCVDFLRPARLLKTPRFKEITTMDETLAHEAVDRAALTELVYRYAVAVDRKDNRLYRSCFLPDATFDLEGVVKHGEEFLDPTKRLKPEEVRGIAGIDRVERSTHAMTDVLIELDGENATVESVVIAYLIGPRDGEPAMVVRGVRYSDRAVRRGTEWKIAHRRHQFMWMFDTKASRIAAFS